MSTGAWLGLTLMLWAISWGFLEYKTLSNETPGDHITAVVRRAFKAQPGPFLLFAFNLGFLFGHFFWP